MDRRSFATATATALTLFSLAPSSASAQAFPTQPIRLIVPFAPGGAVDQTARTINSALAEALGQSVVVDNKPGASGTVGAIDLHRSRPDGYTLMLALDSQAVNHHIVKNLPFDTVKDFDYLSLLVTTPQVLVVRNDYPAQDFNAFVELLKGRPNTVYGSAGTASAGHVNSAQLSIARNLKTTHVPYKGAAPMLTDLLGGHIDFAFAGLSVMLPQIKSGKLRALAVSSPSRSSKVPEVPAMKEFIPGFEYPSWIGIVAPAGLPAEVRQKILASLSKVLQDPTVKSRFVDNAFDIVGSTPAAFTERVRKDSELMADLVKRRIVQPD